MAIHHLRGLEPRYFGEKLMKRSHLIGERFDVREQSTAVLAASMFAASVGMIWDLATGHVSAFERMLTNLSDGETGDEKS